MELEKRSPKPFLLEGGRSGCLMIHGFTGSPAELHYPARRLHRAGFTVHGPLLAGHGTSPTDMERTTWRDWLRSAESGYSELAQRTEDTVIFGLSMGALLGIELASRLPAKALVILAPPLVLRNRHACLSPLMRIFRRYKTKPPMRADFAEILWSYDRTPLSCLPDLFHLIRRSRLALRYIRIPTLIIQGEKDGTVRPESATLAYRRISSPMKEIAMFPDSGHIITADREHEAVMDRVEQFLARVYGSGRQDGISR